MQNALNRFPCILSRKNWPAGRTAAGEEVEEAGEVTEVAKGGDRGGSINKQQGRNHLFGTNLCCLILAAIL
jgi:hypothetical protein